MTSYMRSPLLDENAKSKTRPDTHPMATVHAVVFDFVGRYVGGSHSTLCESQVTHALSTLSPVPLRLTRCGKGPGTAVDTGAFLSAVGKAVSEGVKVPMFV